MDRRSFTKLLALLPFSSATLKAEDGDYKLEESEEFKPKRPVQKLTSEEREDIENWTHKEGAQLLFGKEDVITIGSIVAYDPKI